MNLVGYILIVPLPTTVVIAQNGRFATNFAAGLLGFRTLWRRPIFWKSQWVSMSLSGCAACYSSPQMARRGLVSGTLKRFVNAINDRSVSSNLTPQCLEFRQSTRTKGGG
jgi:hypothetical protein